MLKQRFNSMLCLLLLCLMVGAATGKEWKIDFQGDENHGGVYSQTNPVDMTEEGAVWNIFEVPALDAGYPGPASFVEGPTSLELLDVDGKDWDVVFTDLSDAWGWAGDSGQESLPMAGDYLLVLSTFGVDCDPTYWEITGLAPGSDCTLTFDAAANGAATRTCNFVVNGVATLVTGVDTTSTITVTVDETGTISGTVASGPAEGNWAGLVIVGLPAPRAEATEPTPNDGQSDLLTNVELGWIAGLDAVAHDVYLGMSQEDVTNATRTNPLDVLIAQGQATTTIDPGPLGFGQTYYWRIDEVAAGNVITKGEVWTFTVEPLARVVESVTATSNTTFSLTQGPDKLLDGSGLNADDQHSINPDDMWTGTATPGEPSYLQFEFDRVYKLHEILVWNYNIQWEIVLGYGVKDITVEYSQDGAEWAVLGDYELGQGTCQATYTANGVVPLNGVTAQYVRLTLNSNFAGSNGAFGLSEIRFLYVPVLASEPQPADGAVDVTLNTPLSWRTGREAATHEVYMGTDPNALALAGTTTESSFDAALDLDATLYWQIVEVNDAETPASWTSDVWSFTTQEYIEVEGFETYNDDVDAGTTIWQTWIDMTGDPANGGSFVGNDPSPFAELTIVHSGLQSMPLYYDNANASAFSETDYTLPSKRDWSVGGIKALTLWFYGDSSNTGTLYVKINDTKVLYEGQAGDISTLQWQPWNIDLTATGANLTNVTTLSIGVQGTGQGVVYIDDVRLYGKAPEYATPTEPDSANLVAYYALNGNANDGSGNGYNGTEMGGYLYVNGIDGQALDLDGASGYVDFTNATDWPAGLEPRTMSAWLMSRTTESGARFAVAYGTAATGRAMFVGMIGANFHGGGYANDVSIANYFVADEWYHTCLTYDGVTASLYGNGQLVAAGQREWDLQLSRAHIGQQINDFSEFWDGAIDEVSLYSATLTPDEVAYLAGKTAPVQVPF